MKKALVLLGCPESPSQTPMAVYAANKLSELDYDVTVAANPAATKLVKVSDPKKVYVKSIVDLDRCLNDIKEGDYDLLVGFVHKDAAASFFITFYHLLQCESIALIFEKDMELLESYVDMVQENTDAKIVAVKAFHNPTPIRVRFDKVLEEL